MRQIIDADVHFVEREGEILPAMAKLSGSHVLGVDAEWEPSFQTSSGSGMNSSHVSILQVTLLPCIATGKCLAFIMCNAMSMRHQQRMHKVLNSCAGGITRYSNHL